MAGGGIAGGGGQPGGWAVGTGVGHAGAGGTSAAGTARGRLGGRRRVRGRNGRLRLPWRDDLRRLLGLVGIVHVVGPRAGRRSAAARIAARSHRPASPADRNGRAACVTGPCARPRSRPARRNGSGGRVERRQRGPGLLPRQVPGRPAGEAGSVASSRRRSSRCARTAAGRAGARSGSAATIAGTASSPSVERYASSRPARPPGRHQRRVHRPLQVPRRDEALRPDHVGDQHPGDAEGPQRRGPAGPSVRSTTRTPTATRATASQPIDRRTQKRSSVQP